MWQLGAVAAVVIGVLIVMIGAILASQDKPADGPLITPVEVSTTLATTASTTPTTAQVQTTVSTTTTTQETTTTTEEPTTTTEEPTTTTEEPTTVPTEPTSPPSYEVDGEWNLLLVNPWNSLTEEQMQDESRLVYFENGEYVDGRVADALNDMLEAGAEYGLTVTSGYRSYELQEYLYYNKVDRVINEQGCSYDEALEIAATEVARPGTSEHHTGLAVDLVHNECWDLEEYWEDSAAFDWMQEHCADYGFILRYPKESQHITGVIYEPWHYRYVGVEAAQAIMSSGITLEEYLGAY